MGTGQRKPSGEDTQNLICLIDDQPACGQFGGAEHLPEGGHIKAVVSRRDGVLYVHAAMDETRELVWINHPWGTRAEMWANIKLAWYSFLFAMVVLSIIFLFIGPKNNSYLETFVTLTACGGGLVTVMALWSFKDLKAIAGPSTEYFRLLGFANPESVNLNFPYVSEVDQEYSKRGEDVPKAWKGILSEYQYRNVYSVRAAIKAGKANLLSPRRDAV